MNPQRPSSRRPTSRSPAPPSNPAGERLQKLLAAAGLGSRREIERWIADGRVSVDGRVAQLGARAGAASMITVDGKAVALRAAAAAPRLLLYHKPVGEMVSRRDPRGRRTVFERLPALHAGRWIAIGRLDLNTSGLLLFTDSGELANRLMHPRHQVEREYMLRVLGGVSEQARRRLLAGVPLEDGPARFKQLQPTGKETGANRWFRAVLAEGRNREVRRLLEAVGSRVNRLIRTRFGPLVLPPDLKPGRWIELSAENVVRLTKTC
ncbi:MAG: pseudouridine synthase [Burkholderiales bacterium]